jgi:hypothetical protein
MSDIEVNWDRGEPETLEQLKKSELKLRLGYRGLPLHGNKDNLIQRLKEHQSPLLKEQRLAKEEREKIRLILEEMLASEKKPKAKKVHMPWVERQIYQDSNQGYTLKRAKFSIWIWLCILPLILTPIVYYRMPDDTWKFWFIIFLSLASFASGFGTATTTHQWANSTVETNPYKASMYQALIVLLNWIVIILSFIFVFYFTQASWWEKNFGNPDGMYNVVITLREFMIGALVIEILIDAAAVIYVAGKSERFDCLFIWVFFGVELAVIILSIPNIVSTWIIFAVGTMFAIGHLFGGKFLRTDIDDPLANLENLLTDALLP